MVESPAGNTPPARRTPWHRRLLRALTRNLVFLLALALGMAATTSVAYFVGREWLAPPAGLRSITHADIETARALRARSNALIRCARDLGPAQPAWQRRAATAELTRLRESLAREAPLFGPPGAQLVLAADRLARWAEAPGDPERAAKAREELRSAITAAEDSLRARGLAEFLQEEPEPLE